MKVERKNPGLGGCFSGGIISRVNWSIKSQMFFKK